MMDLALIRLRAEQGLDASDQETLALLDRIAEMEDALGNLKVAFRINMIRCHPSLSHAEIDAAIDAAIASPR